jgi:hypothetical protein
MSKEHDADDIERWIDGGLEGEREQTFRERAARSPELQAEIGRARAIEAALCRRFEPPARLEVPVPVAPTSGQRAAHRALRLLRALPLALAAGALLAFGAWLARERRPERPQDRPVLAADACVDDVFYAAAAADFEPPADMSAPDPELVASFASSPCGELVVVGEWNEPTLDATRVVLVRSGAEPILLFVPKAESTADMCRGEKSDLSLYGGCFKGRPIYELSSMRQSRALPCMRAERLEQL